MEGENFSFFHLSDERMIIVETERYAGIKTKHSQNLTTQISVVNILVYISLFKYIFMQLI